MTIREKIRKLLIRRAALLWPELHTSPVPIEMTEPANPHRGDYATNAPLRLASVLKDNPLRIAEKLAAGWLPAALGTVEVAPPGFLNIRLSDQALRRLPDAILHTGADFGSSESGKGQRVHVEFISANPTGPLHLGNGRGAFIGDTLANVLAATGHRVVREYYVNDQGQQVATLAESVIRKYFILRGVVLHYPEHCYQGTYIDELAKGLKLDGAKADMERLRKKIQATVLNTMLRNIQRLVEKRLQIRFDRWFRESELYKSKLDQQALKRLRKQGLIYEKEGATWLATMKFGDDKDRVVIKSDGEKTYFLSDVAYVNDKFNRRKFDRAIVLLGADHHGYVGRLKAATAALGHRDCYDVIIMQLVRLLKGGQEVRMSKRAGTFVALDELIDEVGPDVARFFFLMHGAGTHMDFDLDLAKERSEKNPVFYVQYAHARIASLVKKVDLLLSPKGIGHRARGTGKGKPGIRVVKGEFGEAEKKLTRVLMRFPDAVEDIARSYAVQQLPVYAQRLAQAFHEYYDTARIIDNEVVNLMRFKVVQAAQQVLRNCLRLMGVSAPEKM